MPRVYNAIKIANASFENNTVKLTVRNEHLLKLLEDNQTAVLTSIKRAFNNSTILLELSIAQSEESKTQTLHLSKDKLQHYIDKNKQFDVLRNSLNLEI